MSDDGTVRDAGGGLDGEIDELVRRLVRLEDQIERKLEAQQARLRYRIEAQRAVFEAEVVRRHRQLRVGLLTFLRRSPLGSLVVAPAVYGLVVPFVLLDLGVSLYQRVCFPIWGMARVRRADHVVLDRHRLAYLNGIEKLNCLYCGYANGVIGYTREVAGRTEQYWCPIKHALRVRAPHERYRGFVDYGDAEGYRARLDTLRAAVRVKDAAEEAR
jgi:hypothetical protein